jgi:hypothetical protein
MIDRIDGLGLAVSLILLALVLELARRRKLTEEYSLLWGLCAIGLLVLSVRRDWLDRSALWLGVYYPPSLLLLILIVLVFVVSLAFSVILSSQRQQIERLIEDTALLAAELREIRSPDAADDGGLEDSSAIGTVPAKPVIPDTSRYRAEPGRQ